MKKKVKGGGLFRFCTRLLIDAIVVVFLTIHFGWLTFEPSEAAEISPQVQKFSHKIVDKLSEYGKIKQF